MLGYNLEEFLQYFGRAWIIDPTDNIRKQVANVEAALGGIIYLSDDKGNISRVPLDKFSWEHVAIPDNLGYRNCGKSLYFFTMRVGRITMKAISDRTASATTVQQIEHNMKILDTKQWDAYRRGAVINASTIKNLTNPKFLTLQKAIDAMVDGEEFGFALSPSTAVVISADHEYNFDLLFQKAIAASSIDGRTWKVRSESLIDPVTRAIGALNYVN